MWVKLLGVISLFISGCMLVNSDADILLAAKNFSQQVKLQTIVSLPKQRKIESVKSNPFLIASRDLFIIPLQDKRLLEVAKKNALLQSVFINLHYLKASEMVKFLQNKSLGLLSDVGRVAFESRHNRLYIRDTHTQIKRILQFIHHLDTPSREVLIKARMVVVERQYVKDLGVVFTTESDQQHEQASVGRITIPIVRLANADLLNMRLSALEEHGHARILARPQLMTLNRQQAMIESGEEIPYQQQNGNDTTSVAFKKAVMRLKVTPIVLPKQQVLLHLQVNQDKVSALVVNGVPAIRTQQLNTTVRVKSSQTVVLGGIFERTRSWQKVGVPVLDRIPLLGLLFQQNKWVDKRSELLVFVTPQIVKNK